MTSMRMRPSMMARIAQTSISRATIRECDDNHLCQEVKYADVYHSETPSDFESWTPLGMTAVPMKQKEEKQKPQQSLKQQGKAAEWNNNQPKGEAAEAIMLYANGQRGHPLALISDRRVRPYDMRPGEAGFYSADGTGQLVYHRVRGDNKDGTYIVACDAGESGGGSGPQARADEQEEVGSKKRFISIRHAQKPKQSRKPKKKQQGGGAQPKAGQEDDSYKHEGDSVNTEQVFTDQRINFNEGGGAIGYYDREKDWMHHMPGNKKKSERCDDKHTHIMSGKEQVIWVDSITKNCYSSKPIIIKPDECKVE
jgi:phage gp45-like